MSDPAATLADRQIAGFLVALRAERGLAENTVRAYRSDLRAYRDWLAERGITDLAEVDEATLRAYPGWLAETRAAAGVATSAATTGRMLSAVRSLHRQLFRDGTLPTDPGPALRGPRRPRRLPKALSIAEVTRLIESAAGDDPVSLRDRAILEFLYATGCRVSELTGLVVDDVQTLERVDDAPPLDVVRLRGKGDRQRIVPVGACARHALDAYLVRVRPALAARGRSRSRLFLGVRGGPLSRQAVWEIIARAGRRAGLPEHRVSPHVLRHSFATHLVSGGADLRVVQELLGHASVTTTQIYTRVTEEHLREVYATSHPRAHRATPAQGRPTEPAPVRDDGGSEVTD